MPRGIYNRTKKTKSKTPKVNTSLAALVAEPVHTEVGPASMTDSHTDVAVPVNECCLAPIEVRVLPSFTDRVITQLLENVVGFLDSHRQVLERERRFDSNDVRDHGDNNWARSLLSGVPYPIRYHDLAVLVDEMKGGLAHRRVAQLPA